MLLDIQGDMNAVKNTMNELKKLSDEEKAEENYIKYRDANCKITRNDLSGHLHKDWRESGIDRHKAFTDGFIYGLDEGRNEVKNNGTIVS